MTAATAPTNSTVVSVSVIVKARKEVVSTRNSSCGKVMFSQSCVKNSIHGSGEVYTPLETPQADTPWTHTHSHLDTPPPRTHTYPLGKPPDGHCRGRYASYWNAFLFQQINHIWEPFERWFCLPVCIWRGRRKRWILTELAEGNVFSRVCHSAQGVTIAHNALELTTQKTYPLDLTVQGHPPPTLVIFKHVHY